MTPRDNAVTSLNITAPFSVAAGEQFTVEVNASGGKNLYSAPFVLSYDPEAINFISISEGNFLKQDGKQTEFRSSIEKEAGEVRVSMKRIGNVDGVNGSGRLLTAIFKGRKKGVTGLRLKDIVFTAPGGAPLEAVPYNIAIEIK